MNFKNTTLKLTINERAIILRAAALLESAANMTRLYHKTCALQRDFIELSQRITVIASQLDLPTTFTTRGRK